MKQFKLTFLLIVLMGMVGAKAFAHDIEVKNADGVTIYYRLDRYTNDYAELVVSYRGSSYSSSSNEYSGVVNIPESVTYGKYTYPVKSIGNEAFRGCSGLTSVIIPTSVKSIGQSSFYNCSSLTEINVDKNNTAYSSIDGVLSNKSQTKLVCYPGGKQGAYTIPNSVTSIGESAFYGCKGLTSVTIGNSVTSIGGEAFYGCSGLTSVTIGNSVTSIGSYAFQGCSGLTSVTIPNSVKSIGGYTFDGCRGLTSVTIPNSVKSIGAGAFSGCTGLTSIYIPDSVKTIGIYTFQNCSGLTYVAIGNSVTSIGSYAFQNCSGLRSITIPHSVTFIGDNAFPSLGKVIWLPSTPPSGYAGVKADQHYVSNDSYTSLSSRTVYPYLNSMFEVGGVKYVVVNPSARTCAAIDCIHDASIKDIKIGNIVSHRGVTMTVAYIIDYLCYGNVFIKNVEIEYGGSIGKGAFAGCPGLTSVTINSNALVSKNYTSDSSLKNIFGSKVSKYVLGDSIKSIGNYAFCDCTGLTSVTIPSSVTSIGDYAFCDCTGLTSVIIPNSVTSIGNSAFRNCSGLTSVTIPNSVTSIGGEAFYKCAGLTSIDIPNSVTSIGRYAFYDCSGLTSVTIGNSVTIPNSVTSIGYRAFYDCSGLTSVTIGNSVTIPNSVTSIGYRAFYDCSGLTSVIIGNSVNSIGSGAFSGCSSLTSVTIGNSVTSIGGEAFSGCSGLTSVTIPNSVTSIGIGAFYKCTGLTSVYIPDSVKTIGNYAFENCSGLTSVTIGKFVTNLGDYAFAGCTNITKLTSCATTPPICGTQALTDINKWDCTLIVPTGSLSAYQAADQWKDFFFIEESDVTAIKRIYDDEAEGRIIGIYDLNGRKLERLQRGMNIVRMSDGTTKKVVIK